MRKYTVLMWVILAVSILKNVPMPHGMEIEVGSMRPAMLLDYFVQFVGVDVLLLLWAIYAFMHTRKIISGILVWLSVGLLIKEFINPYGYTFFELGWDMMGFALAIIFFVYRKQKDNDGARTYNIRQED